MPTCTVCVRHECLIISIIKPHNIFRLGDKRTDQSVRTTKTPKEAIMVIISPFFKMCMCQGLQARQRRLEDGGLFGTARARGTGGKTGIKHKRNTGYKSSDGIIVQTRTHRR